MEVPTLDASGMDRRAWWTRDWLVGTRCIQTSQVFEIREPVLLIGNDDDDELLEAD